MKINAFILSLFLMVPSAQAISTNNIIDKLATSFVGSLAMAHTLALVYCGKMTYSNLYDYLRLMDKEDRTKMEQIYFEDAEGYLMPRIFYTTYIAAATIFLWRAFLQLSKNK
jgi:hypothetical protein